MAADPHQTLRSSSDPRGSGRGGCGGTALSVALDHPARARRLVLVDAAGLDLKAWYGPLWRSLDAKQAAGAADWIWGVVYDLAVEKRTPLVERVKDELLSTRHDPQAARATANFKSVVDNLLAIDRGPELGRVKSRTLVVTGAHDRLVDPAVSKQLASGINGAAFVVYDDIGHLPQLEDPQRLSDDIVAFLRQPEPPSTSLAAR